MLQKESNSNLHWHWTCISKSGQPLLFWSLSGQNNHPKSQKQEQPFKQIIKTEDYEFDRKSTKDKLKKLHKWSKWNFRNEYIFSTIASLLKKRLKQSKGCKKRACTSTFKLSLFSKYFELKTAKRTILITYINTSYVLINSKGA